MNQVHRWRAFGWTLLLDTLGASREQMSTRKKGS
jgi:hypothetical protein